MLPFLVGQPRDFVQILIIFQSCPSEGCLEEVTLGDKVIRDYRMFYCLVLYLKICIFGVQ